MSPDCLDVEVFGPRRSDPAARSIFLLACTINSLGAMDLPAFVNGKQDGTLRAEFNLGANGEITQRCYRAAASERSTVSIVPPSVPRGALDMVFLAECLSGVFGFLTPPLFRMAVGSNRQLLYQGPTFDRQRLRLLHDAFSLYLLAYEERLI